MSARRLLSSVPLDPEAVLLASVLRRSLTRMETDARRLSRKNATMLRLTIEMSEREATKEAAAKAKVDRHAKEQDCLLRRLSGMSCSSDSDLTDGYTFSSDDDAPPHADAYTEEGHSRADSQKGKGPLRKW